MILFDRLAKKDYRNFVTTRDNIYAGKLIAPITPDANPVVKYYDELENELTGDELVVHGKVNKMITGGEIYRKMLFSLNEYNLSHDLLFDSPNYYVRGVEPKTRVDKFIMIGEYYNLEELLKYFNFNKLLIYKDIKKIYQIFLKNDHFLYKNAEVFGLILEKRLGVMGYYPTDKDHPLSNELFDGLTKLTSNPITPNYEEKIKQRLFKRQNG